MRFQFYSEALDNVPKLSVDGTVDNSIHFSHWQGNTTPAEVKADTSTEIALKLVASPNRAALTQGIDLVVNNHFDTDGALSCWTVLNGERALAYRDLLISAAEAGDFSEHTSDDGMKVSIAIQGADTATPNNIPGSPLAGMIAGEMFDEVGPSAASCSGDSAATAGSTVLPTSAPSSQRSARQLRPLLKRNRQTPVCAPSTYSPDTCSAPLS